MNFKRLIFSHYLYNGVGGAAGVFIAGVIGYFLGGWSFLGAMSTGAVLVHLVDSPCPPSLKARQVIPILFAAILITLLVVSNTSIGWQFTCVVVLSIVSSILASLGKAAMPYSFAVLYAMMMGMAVPLHGWPAIFEHVSLLGAGGGFYAIYVIVKEYALELRSKQQILAECLHEFSGYLRLKSELFSPNSEEASLELLHAQIIRQQAKLTEKLQDSRNILFTRIRSGRGGYLCATLFAVFDAYESALSSQTDLTRLLQQKEATGILKILGGVMRSNAEDLDVLAQSVMRNTASGLLPDYPLQLLLARSEIDRLAGQEGETTTVKQLRGLSDKMQATIEHTVYLSRTTSSSKTGEGWTALELDEDALQAFVSPGLFHFQTLCTHLRTQLRLNSPAMRYTLRMTLAMTIGFSIASVLPYETHSYWVLLTIAVVLRSSYTQTKQRGIDRVLGTLVGCLIAGLILYFVKQQLFLMAFLFVAVAVARTMVTVRYRYTAAAAAVMAMIQIHMLNPGAEFLVGERLIDTLVGALLAYLFSFVLPNWEHRHLPEALQQLVDACLSYARQALSLSSSAMSYRQTRRQFHDALSSFSQIIDRMLGEPKFRQLPLEPLETTAAQGYLLAANMAAVRVLLSKHQGSLDPALSRQQLAQVCEQIVLTLEQPQGAPRRLGRQQEPSLLGAASGDPYAFDIQTELEQRLEHIRLEMIPFAAALKRVLKSHRRMEKKFSGSDSEGS